MGADRRVGERAKMVVESHWIDDDGDWVGLLLFGPRFLDERTAFDVSMLLWVSDDDLHITPFPLVSVAWTF